MSAHYFVQIADSKGRVISSDGGTLFEVSDFGFDLTQRAQASPTTLGGTGDVLFGDVRLTVASSGLSNTLAAALTSGTRLDSLDLFAVGQDSKGNLSSTPAVHDTFSTVYVTGDTVDPETGLHTFTLSYTGGVKESAAQFDAVRGAYTGTTVTASTPGSKSGAGSTPDFAKAVTSTVGNDQELDTYVRFTDAKGAVLGGSTVATGSGGWIKIDSASFGASTGLEAGSAASATLSALGLNFAPGTLESTLLSTMTSGGQGIGIELASYAHTQTGTTLVDDYRFGNASVSSVTRTADTVVQYSFNYSDVGSTHYSAGRSAVSTSYSELSQNSVTKYLPTQEAPQSGIEHAQFAHVSTSGGGDTSYYIQLTDWQGNVIPAYAARYASGGYNTGPNGEITPSQGNQISPAGASVFRIDNFSFALSQAGSVTSAIGGSGDLQFGNFTLTVGSGALSAILSRTLANAGTNQGRLDNLDLFGVHLDTKTDVDVSAVHDGFSTVYVTGDAVDPVSGNHTFTLNYTGGVKHSATLVDPSTGALTGTTVTAGTKGSNFGTQTTPNFSTAYDSPRYDTDSHTFVRLTDARGQILGGDAVGTRTGGWIQIDNASFGSSAVFDATRGVSAGMNFSPLHLAFRPGILEPTLLSTMTGSGQDIGIEIASYRNGPSGSQLVSDYRFGNATVDTLSRTSDAVVNYTFNYTQFGGDQIIDNGNGAIHNTTGGGNLLPARTASDTKSPIDNGQSGTAEQNGHTNYYVQFTDGNGQRITSDGGRLFQVNDFTFALSQAGPTTSGPSTSGAASGVRFGDVTLTIASSGLSTILSAAFANRTQLDNVDLYAVAQTIDGSRSATPAVHDGFSTVYVTGDTVNPETGIHTFTLNYSGGIKQSSTQVKVDGSAGATVTASTPGGDFGAGTTPDFNAAVTTTMAADDRDLETYVRFTDGKGGVLGGSAVASGPGGWVRIDSAGFGGHASFNTVGGTPGHEALSPLDLTFAPGILEPTLLSSMTSSGQRIGIEIASYARNENATTLVDDYRFGNVTVASSSRGSDATVHYTFDYSEYGTSHYVSGKSASSATSANYSEATGSKTTQYLPSSVAPLTGIDHALTTRIGTGEISIACFATGTQILTSRGEVPVEALSEGDLVVTATGELRPIRWIGHRQTDCVRHPDPIRVMPVRIEAGAVAPGVPKRDLRVSPDHAIALDGVLVKAGRLVNGVNIIRESVPNVTYWHVELDRHDLLVADGLPAESYIESNNRHAFDNAGAVVQAHPDFEALGDYASRTCLPLVEGGDRLKAIRAGLFARISDRFATDPDLMVLADGTALTPVATDGRHVRFDVPEGTTALRLVSRAAMHSEMQSDSRDHRRFGVLVRKLVIDGHATDYDALGDGWLAQAPGRDHRWTDGNAALPLGRSVTFVTACLERYPITSDDGRWTKAA